MQKTSMFGIQKFCITLLTFLTEEIQPWMAAFLFRLYPFTTFHYERIYILFSLDKHTKMLCVPQNQGMQSYKTLSVNIL